ncbi:hypothetical protein CDAR_248811 [Caerostris darwini]|uniref:Uncharacterized protein n=1 Tax=Caerostris darwini TaxID=1538125 RepID=A0AAV4VKM7_9ARAC|nr:hypothetical protein CDAR_248811 [Caerostris darwini]
MFTWENFPVSRDREKREGDNSDTTLDNQRIGSLERGKHHTCIIKDHRSTLTESFPNPQPMLNLKSEHSGLSERILHRLEITPKLNCQTCSRGKLPLFQEIGREGRQSTLDNQTIGSLERGKHHTCIIKDRRSFLTQSFPYPQPMLNLKNEHSGLSERILHRLEITPKLNCQTCLRGKTYPVSRDREREGRQQLETTVDNQTIRSLEREKTTCIIKDRRCSLTQLFPNQQPMLNLQIEHSGRSERILHRLEITPKLNCQTCSRGKTSPVSRDREREGSDLRGFPLPLPIYCKGWHRKKWVVKKECKTFCVGHGGPFKARKA